MAASSPRMLEALRNPATYPHPAREVGVIETYISHVFLAGDFAYKVKKPVDYGYLDFTTLERREFFCRREVELNRRLCPGIYLGVVPIVESGAGVALWDPVMGKAAVVDYAVKMVRLPQDMMMDSLLNLNVVMPGMVAEIAKKLAEFHKKAESTPEISVYGHPDEVRYNAIESLEQTERHIGAAIPGKAYWRIRGYTEGFLKDNRSLFYKRVNDNRIRDCHGDLHSQHICFFDSIQIFDCIEFNDRFRYGDVASEVAFLAMDLDFHGRPDLSRAFVDEYIRISGDADLVKLLNFYKVYRAYVRGKVNCFRSEDEGIPQEERAEALGRAERYFSLAEGYIK